jgi:hypothetical protein
MLQTKSSINQIKNIVDRLTNRQDQAGERISGIEGKTEKILHTDGNKEKNQQHNQA